MKLAWELNSGPVSPKPEVTILPRLSTWYIDHFQALGTLVRQTFLCEILSPAWVVRGRHTVRQPLVKLAGRERSAAITSHPVTSARSKIHEIIARMPTQKDILIRARCQLLGVHSRIRPYPLSPLRNKTQAHQHPMKCRLSNLGWSALSSLQQIFPSTENPGSSHNRRDPVVFDKGRHI